MTVKSKRQTKDAMKEREHKLMLKHKYDTRITNVRIGKEAFEAGDFITAIRKYTEYLETIAEIKGAGSIYDLKPPHFDKNRDITEMLMISHLYLELAKVYDATGKFTEDTDRCLDQFVLFTANQPFQVVNSETLRKTLRKFRFKRHDAFFKAYQQIFIKSRRCYIATMCLGEEDPCTAQLREFKRWLLAKPGGLGAVSLYYRVSSRLVSHLETKPLLASLLRLLATPLLRGFSRLGLPLILKP